MFKLFKWNKVSADMDVLIKDVDEVRIAFDEVYESVQESNRLIAKIQEQFSELAARYEAFGILGNDEIKVGESNTYKINSLVKVYWEVSNENDFVIFNNGNGYDCILRCDNKVDEIVTLVATLENGHRYVKKIKVVAESTMSDEVYTQEDILESCDRIDKIIEGYGSGEEDER